MAAMATATAVQVGDFVTIDVQDRRYHSASRVWEVLAINEDRGRVVVKSEILDANISVRITGVKKLELPKVPSTCLDLALTDDAEQTIVVIREAVQNTWEAEKLLGHWRQLPGFGATEFRFFRCQTGENELAFYPLLRSAGIGLEFRSHCFDFGIIRLERTDVLAWCPQKCVWVLCFCCQKFLWGPQEHRCSNRHQRLLLSNKCMSAADLCENYGSHARATRPLYCSGQLP